MLATAPSQLTKRLVFNNGITLIVTENRAADLISARLFFPKAGSRYEPLEKSGLSHLLAAVITKGTTQFTAVEIAEQIESIGASLGASTANDYWLLNLKTVTGDFLSILELAGEILRSPTFPDSEVELERHLTLQNIRSQQEQPFNIAYNQLREGMYRNHPYGASVLGSETTVPTITREDLKQYHQTHFRPDNLVISLSGNITVEQAEAYVEKVLGDWKNPQETLDFLTIPKLIPQSQTWKIAQESQQAIVMLGYLAGSIADPDYFALKLLSTYLGNGLSSRLFVELREKRGLAYDVSAFYPTRLDQSQFVTYIGTAPINAAIALEGLQAEMQRLYDHPLSETELQTAKNKLLGQYALGKQTNSEIAQTFGWYESLGLGINFDQQFQQAIAAVTTEAAQKAAQNHFQNAYISIVGPKTALDLLQQI